MKELKYILIALMMLPLTLAVSSCSEENEADEEFANWQERNDDMQTRWANNTSFLKFKTFTMDPNTPGGKSDYIYVEVLESGDASFPTPSYTDTCRVAYRGRLIPSKSYPDGYVFDQSFIGAFKWELASVSQGASWMDGFATALMNMHIGDYWRVHIPYQLMYGSASSTSYPSYSNMVFEIALYDYWHPGEKRPNFKTRD